MKGRQVLALVGVLLLLAALVPASPSAAKSKKTTVDVWEVLCLIQEGFIWFSDDGIMHMRGRQSQGFFYDAVTLDVVGTDTIVGNANIDPLTENGTFFGTWSVVHTSFPGGTFDGRWSAQMTGGVEFSGNAVGQGTAYLRGMKMRLRLNSDPDIPHGLLAKLQANPPCAKPTDMLGILHDKGTVLDPHGG